MLAAQLQTAWPWLAGVGVRVTPIFIAALLADHLLRRRNAALRHAVWRATLGAVLVLAVGTAVLPSWQVALLAPRPALAPAQTPPPDGVRTPALAVEETTKPRAGIPRATDAPSPPLPITATCVAIWLAISVAMLLRVLRDQRAVVRSVRKAHALTAGPAASLTAQLAHDLGIARPVRVLLHGDAIIPHTFGIRQATLMLPHDAEHWQRDRLERVIVHELAHVQRGDALECVVMRFVSALFWFHPGAWLLSRRLHATREAACDDIVLLRGARASDYATDLLDTVRRARDWRLPATVPAMARHSALHTRLSDILDDTRTRRPDARGPRRLLRVACVAVTVPLAAVHPVPRHAAEPQRARAHTMPVANHTASVPRTAFESAPRRDMRPVVPRRSSRSRAGQSPSSHAALLAVRLASLDSICAVTNGRTRGELLVALTEHWMSDARFIDAYFRVLDGIPDARVRAEVVTQALHVSRTPATLERARTIIDGLPDRGLRDAMTDDMIRITSTAGGGR